MDRLLGGGKRMFSIYSTSSNHNFPYGCGPSIFPHHLLVLCRPIKAIFYWLTTLSPKDGFNPLLVEWVGEAIGWCLEIAPPFVP
jgi:hypothetical protein